MSPIEENNDEEGGVAVENSEEEYEELAKWLEENKEDPHIKDISVYNLTPEDLRVFDKFQKGTLSEKELADHNKKISEEFEKSRMDKKKENEEAYRKYLGNSRVEFGALLKSKMLVQMAKLRLKQLGKSSE